MDKERKMATKTIPSRSHPFLPTTAIGPRSTMRWPWA